MNVIIVGKRLIPSEQVALIEPFDPSSMPDVTYQKNFQGRILLRNRDYVLTEQTPAAFADEHGFRSITEDDVAVNPLIVFTVENFEPTEQFNPARPFKTRLKWRDHTGHEQSKLLLAKAEHVLAELTATLPGRPTRRSSPKRSKAKRVEAAHD
jgi:hypothetical protein